VQVIVRTSLLDLVEVGLDETSASDALLARVDAVLAWVAQYMGPGALAGQAPDSMRGNKPGPDPPPRMAITDVVDIEEMVWAPRYGLKGQIDATLGVVLSDANHEAAARASTTTFPAPCARSSRPSAGLTSAASARGSGTSTGTAAGFGSAAAARPSAQVQRFSGGRGQSSAAASLSARHSDSGSVQCAGAAGSMGHASGGLGGSQSGGRASSGSSRAGPAHFRGLMAASGSSTATGMPGQQQQQQQQQQQYTTVGYQHPCRPAAQIVPFEFKSGRNYFLHRAQVRTGLCVKPPARSLLRTTTGALPVPREVRFLCHVHVL
ncbi:hypothetical protein DUNSADRAFT_7911, partial [Dunaliella salina]